MTSYNAIPLNAEESALMQDGSCVGVLIHCTNWAGPPTSPDIHLMLRSVAGKTYFCGSDGPTMPGLARIVRDLEGSQAYAYQRAMAD